jgi:Glycosyltransferase
VIDGIASGVPVVTNLGGYTSDLINSYDVGYAKEKATAEDLTEAIKRIKEDKMLESNMRNNSRNLLDSHFLWENNIEKLENFLIKEEFK